MRVIQVSWGRWGLYAALLAIGCTTPPRGQPLARTSAETVPEQAAAASPVTDSHLAVARKLEQQGQWAEARAAYAALLQRDPNNVACLHRLAVVCTAMEDHVAAAGYYNQALHLAPQHVDLLTDAGYACYLRNEYAAAEALLRDAVTLAPQHERAVNNLALLLGMTDRMEESLAAFWQVNPPVDAWRNMSYVYQQRGEWDSALACYDEARKLDPEVTIPASLLAHREAVTAEPQTQLAAAVSEPSEITPVISADVSPDAALDVIASSSELFVEPATVEADSVEIEQAVAPAAAEESLDSPDLSDQDFGPFEPPVIVEPASAPGESSDQRVSSRLPTGALPIITPGWPGLAPFEDSASDPALAVVLTERPLKRGVDATPFDVVYAGDRSPEPVSAATIELAGEEWAEEVVQTSAVVAEADQTNLLETPVDRASAALALTDCCLVALHEDRRLVSARPEFAVSYHDQLFCFASARAAEQFASNPERYLPAAAGLDVVAVRSGWVVVAGSLDHAVWFRGKLFLFASADNLVAFQAHPDRYVDYE